jgi:hypothetical protein
MKGVAIALLVSALAFTSMTVPTSAQTYQECEAKAVSKTKGTPLTGASKTSSINKCLQAPCEAKAATAVDRNGKKLAGATKNSFMKKCLKGG